MSCQAVDCNEIAEPWGLHLDLGPVEIVIRLCHQHERALLGPPLEPAKPTPVDKAAGRLQ